MMRTLLLLLSLMLPTLPVHSQLLPDPNTRVRVYAPSVAELRMIGTLGATVGDSVLFRRQDGGGFQALSRAAIEELEVSRGRAGNALNGAVAGGVVGAAVGATAFARDCTPVCGAAQLIGGALGGLGGLIIGAIVGEQFKEGPERWHRVLPELRPLEAGPSRLGRGLDLAVDSAEGRQEERNGLVTPSGTFQSVEAGHP